MEFKGKKGDAIDLFEIDWEEVAEVEEVEEGRTALTANF